LFLQMYEGPGELDETLVKITVHTVPVRQPQVFQNVVRLVKFLLVEQREVAGVARINPVAGKLPGKFSDAFMLIHAAILILRGKI